jgi:hypothetical protein
MTRDIWYDRSVYSEISDRTLSEIRSWPTLQTGYFPVPDNSPDTHNSAGSLYPR